MARRQRVPRHKEQRRKRNKNPKLSPFQREQQRTKLANQPPILSIKNGSQRDYPVSQRAVMEYLIAKQKRRLEKKQKWGNRQLEEKNANISKTTEDVRGESLNMTTEVDNSFTSSSASSSLTNSLIPPQQQTSEKSDLSTSKKDTRKKKELVKQAKKSSIASPVALNAVIADSLPRPIMAFKTRNEGYKEEEQQERTVETIIAKKKEKKHRKKSEARRERIKAMLLETEKQLKEEVLSTKNSKKRIKGNPIADKDAAFERELKQMQKEKAAKEAAEKRTMRQNNNNNKSNKNSTLVDSEKKDDSKRKNRKRITFSDGVPASDVTDAPHSVMRYPKDKGSKTPQDFHELVDIVRYGERVEAPPVFDVLPRHDNSVTRLANRLQQSSRNLPKKSLSSTQVERLHLLSSTSGGGGVGGERRLERLGLQPLSAAPHVPQNTRKLSKKEEMERLRETVMTAYRRNKREGVGARNSVDLHHQFPVFS